MTFAEAATPPARLASWKFRSLGISVARDSVHVEFVPCHSAGTLPSLHALTRCVLFGQRWSQLYNTSFNEHPPLSQAWRRMNKKGKVDESGKKRTRKAQKFQKAIVGMCLAE